VYENGDMKNIFQHWCLPVFLYCVMMSCSVDLCWAADAIVLDVSGKVELIGRDQTGLIHSGQVLHADDQLKSQGGTAKIIYADGRMLTLEVGKTLQIATQTQTTQPDSVASKIIKSLGEMTQETQGPTRKAMVRKGIQRIPIISPCNTAIMPDKKSITWKPLPQLQTLELVLKPASSSTMFSFPLDPGSEKFTLSADRAELRSGIRYYWKLNGSDKNGRRYASRTCWLTILSDEQVRTLQEDLHVIEEMQDISPKGRDFLTASLYLAYQLYDRVSPLLKAYPDDPGMQVILENVQEIKGREF
jgi:hypothetical protein